MGRKFWIVVLVGAGLCLAAGVIWTIRLDVPSPTPWWYGKKAVVRAEVWEPGKDMATFAMTLPKGPLDAFYALGMKGTIDFEDGREVELGRVWKRLQRLPRGEKITFEDDGATVSLWIEVPSESPAAAP